MATQHDKIFKQLLRVFLEDFLRLVAPRALKRLDLSAPELLDKELFAGGPRGRRRELDLLVRVRTLDGRPLLIHVEIEARASRGSVNLLTWASSLGPDFPEPRYLSFGLAGGRAADYLDRPEPLAWALAALLDPGPWSRAELKMACLRRIAGLKGQIDPHLLVDCVENYLELEPWEVAEFKVLDSQRENQEVRAMKMTWSETQRAVGRTQGFHHLLLLQLAEKFGPLPEKVRQQIEAINSPNRLAKLGARILTAHSLEEMGLV